MNNKKLTIVSFLVLFFSGISTAAPILSIDANSLVGGIQTSLITNVGENFTVDINITGVEIFSPLNAFEFDLDFNSTVLVATNIVSGNFLPFGFGIFPPLIVESDIAAPDVNYAEAVIGSAALAGSGILVSITFDVIGAGLSNLILNDIILSAPFGVAISLGGITDATITANNNTTSVVSAPPPFLLLAIGLGFIGLFARKQQQISPISRFIVLLTKKA